MKFSDIKKKLIMTAAYFAILVLWNLLDLPSCMWIFLYEIPCPGCGMTRACLAALRFDFAAAFYFHPMFWSMPLLYLYFLSKDGIFRSKKANRVFLIAVLVGFVLSWVRSIILFFVK